MHESLCGIFERLPFIQPIKQQGDNLPFFACQLLIVVRAGLNGIDYFPFDRHCVVFAEFPLNLASESVHWPSSQPFIIARFPRGLHPLVIDRACFSACVLYSPRTARLVASRTFGSVSLASHQMLKHSFLGPFDTKLLACSSVLFSGVNLFGQ